MDDDDVAFAGITRQAALIRSGEISSTELVELYLSRIEALDPHVNAFRVVLADDASADAGRADARRRSGDERPLLGIPVAIKDGWDVAGQVTTHGTGAAGPVASADCVFVERLRAAGAVILGKTTQPELAIWMFTESDTWGKTRNPWNLDYIPGGSSGGSAAAVAAGLVGAGSGSDGAGSLRLPATACGLFGLKPQRGRVPLAPYVDHWHGLTAAGCLTRTVADTALWLDTVSGPSTADPTALPLPAVSFSDATAQNPGRLRVALSYHSLLGEQPSDELRTAVASTGELLSAIGHRVDDAEPDYTDAEGNPGVFDNHRARYLRGISDDASRVPHPDRLMKLTRDLAQIGSGVNDAIIARQAARQETLAAGLNRMFDEHDLVVSPVVPQQPFRVGEHDDLDAAGWAVQGWKGFSGSPYLVAWNVTGQPAASIPAGFDRNGLPLAVQLIARPGDEATLLAVAAQLEAERPWAGHRPPIR